MEVGDLFVLVSKANIPATEEKLLRDWLNEINKHPVEPNRMGAHLYPFKEKIIYELEQREKARDAERLERHHQENRGDWERRHQENIAAGKANTDRAGRWARLSSVAAVISAACAVVSYLRPVNSEPAPQPKPQPTPAPQPKVAPSTTPKAPEPPPEPPKKSQGDSSEPKKP